MNLQWHHIELAPDDGYCIRIKKQKTETEATLAISYEAYKLGGEQDTGKIFKGLAGITKHIAFHYSTTPLRSTPALHGNRHLHHLQDADAQECLHHPNLRRPHQRQEAQKPPKRSP